MTEPSSVARDGQAGSVLGEWADDDELREHLVACHGFSASILLGHGGPGLRHVHRYEHRWELDVI